jgi:hypothetical protein
MILNRQGAKLAMKGCFSTRKALAFLASWRLIFFVKDSRVCIESAVVYALKWRVVTPTRRRGAIYGGIIN